MTDATTSSGDDETGASGPVDSTGVSGRPSDIPEESVGSESELSLDRQAARRESGGEDDG